MPQPLPTPAAPRSTPAAGGVSFGRRAARLRPEYAGRYPGVQAGVWEPAAVLSDRVMAAGLLRGSLHGWHDRALPPEHFEFRGGETPVKRPRREDR
jgi:hypothetical protein